MLSQMHVNKHHSTRLQLVYVYFLRIMAAVCFVSGLIYWAQITGMSGDGLVRFDLLDTKWRVVSTTLAVLLPSAALGLWLTQSWGIVLWICAMCIEIGAFGIWSNMFVAKPMLVLGHLVSIAFICLISAARYLERYRHGS